MYNNNENQAKARLVYSGSLTLTDKKDKQGMPAGLKGGCVISINGRDGQPHAGVFIPLEMNPSLYHNKKDNSVTLDINVFENSAPKFDQTHFIRPSVGKKGQTMSEQARREATPIIGNLKPFAPKNEQSAPQGAQNLGGGFNPYATAPQGAPQGAPQAYGQVPQGAPAGGYAPQAAPADQGLNPGVMGDLPF